MRFLKIDTKKQPLIALFLFVLLFILLRIPSLVEPDWYGDEGIYQVVGMALRQGRLLYAGIWDNKPPLLYLFYAIFNGDLFWLKLSSLIFGALSVVLFFFISKRLFTKKSAVYLATGFYALLFGLPFIEGNIANAENFMHLPIFIGLLFFLKIYENPLKNKEHHVSKIKRRLFLLIVGFFLSIAFSLKIVAIFDFLAFFLVSFIFDYTEEIASHKHTIPYIVRSLKRSSFDQIWMVIGFISLPVITALYFLQHHALRDYIAGVYSTNVSYVNVNNSFFLPLGLVWIKLILLAVALLILVRIKDKMNTTTTFIYFWLVFSVFNAFFSEREYTHYLLVLLPSFSLLVGLLIEQKKKIVLHLAMLIILCIVIQQNFILYTKTFSYYKNYFSFTFGNESLYNYQAFFDSQTPQMYAASQMVSAITTSNTHIFLLSNSAQIYALTGKLPPGRYITSYHISFYNNAVSETKQALTKVKPQYIIQTPEVEDTNSFLAGYTLRYIIGTIRIYERQS